MYWQECYERVGRWVALRQVEDGSEKGIRWVDEMYRKLAEDGGQRTEQAMGGQSKDGG